jgi:hypothetical protein
MRFVCEELIPWVGSEYRIDPEDRCYGRVSRGGLFGVYTLLTRPEAFSRYIIGSPAIYHEDPEVFRYERDNDAFNATLVPPSSAFGCYAVSASPTDLLRNPRVRFGSSRGIRYTWAGRQS